MKMEIDPRKDLKNYEYLENWMETLCDERKAELFDEIVKVVACGYRDRKDPVNVKPKKSLEDCDPWLPEGAVKRRRDSILQEIADKLQMLRGESE